MPEAPHCHALDTAEVTTIEQGGGCEGCYVVGVKCDCGLRQTSVVNPDTIYTDAEGKIFGYHLKTNIEKAEFGARLALTRDCLMAQDMVTPNTD